MILPTSHSRIIPFACLSAILLAAPAAPASTLFLASDIAQFIPSCARSCILSFISVNFDESTCGTSTPGLQCLCAERGPSGFTLGEGAVQCVVAERQTGFCSENETPDVIVNGALDMCSGQENAVEPTNTQLVATLILPSSGVGVITFPTPTKPPKSRTLTKTTHSKSSSRSSSSPSSTSSTSSNLISIISSTTLTSSETSTSSTTSSSSAATSSASFPVPISADGDHAAQDNGGLSSGQAAGIIVGIIAAFALVLSCIFFARKRRRGPKISTADISSPKPMGDRLSNSVGFTSNNGRPITPAPAHYPPPSGGWRPETIGLAVTGDTNFPPPAKNAKNSRGFGSELLPSNIPVVRSPGGSTAPSMTTVTTGIGKNGSDTSLVNALSPPPMAKPNPAVSGPADGSKSNQPPIAAQFMRAPPGSAGHRESDVTEFEEYGTAPLTGTSNNQSGIWRPPATPSSPSTYYVADQAGNWRLGPGRESDVLNASLLSPDVKLDVAQSVKFQKPKSFSPFFHNTQVSRSSSVYSQSTVAPRVVGPDMPPLPDMPAHLSGSRVVGPAAAAAVVAGAPRAHSPPQPVPLTRNSTATSAMRSSGTTFATDGFDASDDEIGRGEAEFLTPLTRSPAAGGHSKFQNFATAGASSYPPVPKVLPQVRYPSKPAPQQMSSEPHRAVMVASPLPAGQSSPTLGVMPISRRRLPSPPPTNPARAPGTASSLVPPASLPPPKPATPVVSTSYKTHTVKEYESGAEARHDGREYGPPSYRSSWTGSVEFGVTASPGLRFEDDRSLSTPPGPPHTGTSTSFLQSNPWRLNLQPESEQQWQLQSHWRPSLPTQSGSSTPSAAWQSLPQEQLMPRPAQQQQGSGAFGSPSSSSGNSEIQDSPSLHQENADTIAPPTQQQPNASFNSRPQQQQSQPQSRSGLGLDEPFISQPVSSIVSSPPHYQKFTNPFGPVQPSNTSGDPLAGSSPSQAHTPALASISFSPGTMSVPLIHDPTSRVASPRKPSSSSSSSSSSPFSSPVPRQSPWIPGAVHFASPQQMGCPGFDTAPGQAAPPSSAPASVPTASAPGVGSPGPRIPPPFQPVSASSYTTTNQTSLALTSPSNPSPYTRQDTAFPARTPFVPSQFMISSPLAREVVWSSAPSDSSSMGSPVRPHPAVGTFASSPRTNNGPPPQQGAFSTGVDASRQGNLVQRGVGAFSPRYQQNSFAQQGSRRATPAQQPASSFAPPHRPSQNPFLPSSRQGTSTQQPMAAFTSPTFGQGGFTPKPSPSQGSFSPKPSQGTFTPNPNQGGLTPKPNQVGSSPKLTTSTQVTLRGPQTQSDKHDPTADLYPPPLSPRSPPGRPTSHFGGPRLDISPNSATPAREQAAVRVVPGPQPRGPPTNPTMLFAVPQAEYNQHSEWDDDDDDDDDNEEEEDEDDDYEDDDGGGEEKKNQSNSHPHRGPDNDPGFNGGDNDGQGQQGGVNGDGKNGDHSGNNDHSGHGGHGHDENVSSEDDSSEGDDDIVSSNSIKSDDDDYSDASIDGHDHPDHGHAQAQRASIDLLFKRNATPLSVNTNHVSPPALGTLPDTPRWNPVVTPEKRGGDLYLNVQ